MEPYIECMTTSRTFARAVGMLRAKGLRTTRQRVALAKLLFDSGGNRHISAEQLHDEALNQSIRVSLATVYNTLHQFTEAELLREAVSITCQSRHLRSQPRHFLLRHMQ